MIKRKLSTSLITFIVAVFIITAFQPLDVLFSEATIKQEDYFGEFLTYSFYVGCGLLFYGFPISLLIDKITNTFKDGRFAFSFILYAFFGFLPFFILWFFTLFSLAISILFFLIDELLRYYEEKRQKTLS
ncbi:hypothetical protein CEQ21_23610 [Niallia circulans]|uniref:Uncharacterized protein n=1 Tax=Niallia circulans TaxID=1397 RepID=A0A553SN13_NIACI|nr:hypothetical protein [Niallia circulans]TRZ38385.1 hypothetical protein CEQ21_23610 [Niallia circulans]